MKKQNDNKLVMSATEWAMKSMKETIALLESRKRKQINWEQLEVSYP